MADSGTELEARVQRLFFAQGLFAERSLQPAADVNRRMMATDIDVLVSEYASGFHLTRRHAECKSGRRFGTMDRVLWLNGVRAMLGADASYLVVQSFDENAAGFARSLGVDVMTIAQLETWEKALNIPANRWPNRSDFGLIDPLQKEGLDLGKEKGASEKDSIVRETIRFVEIDSWRIFNYSILNRLLGVFRRLSDASEESVRNGSTRLSDRYAASAMLVRLSQHLLSICYDVSCVPISDIHSYLLNRLMFGDQDPHRSRTLVNTTVDWMFQALKHRGIPVPLEIDSNRLLQPPTYSDGLVSLIRKLLTAPNEARYLPLAMETEQFGRKEELENFPRLRTASQAGHDFVALVKGFAVASLGVSAALLKPLGQDLTPSRPAARGRKRNNDSSHRQAPLNLSE